MRLTPLSFLSLTLALAVLGAWAGHRLARRASLPPPRLAPQSPEKARPWDGPEQSTLPQDIQAVEALVREYLAAAAAESAEATHLRKRLLSVDSALLKQTWLALMDRAAGSTGAVATHSRHELSTLKFILTEQDPMGTIHWLTHLSRPIEIRNELWSLLEDWSQRDPQAAWQGMLADTIDPDVRDDLHNPFTTIAYNLAKADPSGAFAAFLKLPPDHWLPDYAAEMLCRDAATPALRADMLRQLVQQPPGRLRTTALKAILQAQTANQPLNTVGEWLLQQPLPPEEKDTLIASVAATASVDNPQAALDWLMAHASPGAAMTSFETLVTEWSARPNECGEWLKTLPPGPAKEGALFAFVEEVMQHDPESAFLWTRQFDHPARRQARAQAVWEKWVSLAPVSAAQFAAQLDEQEKKWLKQPVGPDGRQGTK